MAEGGLAGLTVEGTASRAGVAKTTVYRRYPKKLDLAVAAVAELLNTPREPDPDSTADDAVAQFGDVLGSAQAQAAMLAVAAAAATNPDIHKQFSEDVLQPALESIQQSVSDMQSNGEASADLSAAFFYDVVVGTLLHRLVIRRQSPDQRFHDDFGRLVAFVLQGPPKQ